MLTLLLLVPEVYDKISSYLSLIKICDWLALISLADLNFEPLY